MLTCGQTGQAAVETEPELVDLSFHRALAVCSSGCWRHSRWSGSTIMWRGASRGSAAPKCWRLFTGSTCWSTRRSLSSPVNRCRPGFCRLCCYHNFLLIRARSSKLVVEKLRRPSRHILFAHLPDLLFFRLPSVTLAVIYFKADVGKRADGIKLLFSFNLI